MESESLAARVRKQVEELIKRGGDLRSETSRLVSEASVNAQKAAGGLEALVKAVADGAVAGAKETMPEHSESALRSVVDGLTDGLTKSAQALKLALEEATANGTRFAKDDLTKVGQDFRSLGNIVLDIIKGSATAIGGHAKDQANTLATHAKQTFQAALPPLEAALHAAQQDPLKLGREAASAGGSAARQAASALFTELGTLFQKAGEKLRR